MVASGQYRLVQLVWLRAALALVLFALMSLQPAMLAMAKSAMHPDSVVAHADGAADVESSGKMGHDHGSKAVSADDEASREGHHGSAKTADVCCDTHCTSAQLIPVDCPPLPQPSRDRFEPFAETSLLHGMNHEFVHPPRT